MVLRSQCWNILLIMMMKIV
uniref:Uncharacterized protein n=1 Tax=Arundo donax TaxID=35708 RepID=A0A0A9FP25_ARUDO